AIPYGSCEIKLTNVEYSCCKLTSSFKSCSSNTFSKKNSYVPWFSFGPYVLIFSSGQSGLMSDHFSMELDAKNISFNCSAVRDRRVGKECRLGSWLEIEIK